MHGVDQSQEDSTTLRLVIGIDYGTTFSGAAWSIIQESSDVSNDHQDIVISTVTDWKNKNPYCRYSDKVPSDIGYSADGKAFCGFDLPDGCTRLKWMKLLLETDPDPAKAKFLNHPVVRASKHSVDMLGKSAVEVVSDYLCWMWTGIVQSITADTGLDNADIEDMKVTIIMTVPAMWSDMARANTAEAAELAGLSRNNWILKFMTEPEAAAISELHEKIGKGLSVGDCFITCDGGGGTVDLVSFQIKSGKPFTLDQKTTTTGGLCGSIFIDQMFEAQLKSMLQEDWEILSDEARSEIRDKFAFVIKPSYDGNALGSIANVPLPIVNRMEFQHIERNILRIPTTLVHSAFQSVLPRVQNLIEEQEDALASLGLRDKFKGVLLVGGLGCCELLRSSVISSYPRSENVKVLRAKESLTSIVTGAVRCELMFLGDRQVMNLRLSNWNYGFRFNTKFDLLNPDHKLELAYPCPFETTVTKVPLIDWFVRKGDELKPTDQVLSNEFVRVFKRSDFKLESNQCPMQIPLTRSGESSAPNWPNEYAKDFVHLECLVPQELVTHQAEKFFPGPDPAWRVRLRIDMHIHPATLSFRCFIGDVSIGLGRIKYRPRHARSESANNVNVSSPRVAKDPSESETSITSSTERPPPTGAVSARSTRDHGSIQDAAKDGEAVPMAKLETDKTGLLLSRD